jgi:hypothetical protein
MSLYEYTIPTLRKQDDQWEGRRTTIWKRKETSKGEGWRTNN